MINRKCAHTSAVSISLDNWLSRTGQSNYILYEIYHAMEWFGFGDYIKLDSVYFKEQC